MIEHDTRSAPSASHVPPFSFVNRFLADEAAELVFKRSERIIARCHHSRLTVKQVRIDDDLFVIVSGDPPDSELRKELADAFSIGSYVRLTDEQLGKIFSESSIGQERT